MWRVCTYALFLSLMRASANGLGVEGAAALGRSLTALTALRDLSLNGKASPSVLFQFFLFREPLL
jgi:hypothetical protein